MLYLKNFQSYIPSTRLRVEQDYAHFGLTPAQAKIYTKFYGLREIPIECELDSGALLKKTIKHVPNKPIAFLIHAHTSDVISPFGQSTVQELKKALSLNQTIAFGTSMNKCASILTAFEMASVLLTPQKKAAHALIVCGEISFTKESKWLPGISLIGDAAAAVLVGNRGTHDKLLGLTVKTHGQYAKGIWVSLAEHQAFEKAYIPLLSELLTETLAKAGVGLSDLKLILPHNVNIPIWKKFARYFGIPMEKIYLSMLPKWGHCFGTDVLLNYIHAKTHRRLKKGDHYLMISVGTGAVFGAAIFRH